MARVQGILGIGLLTGLLAAAPVTAGAAALILNEYNAVAPASLLDDGNSTDPYFGAVMGNGGDWVELVVIADHLDIRGWKVNIVDNGGADSDALLFTNNPLWADLRAGTIITIAEEVADDPSYDPAQNDWWINVQSGTSGNGTYITAADFTTSNSDTTVEIRTVDDLPIFGPAGEPIRGVGVNGREMFKLETDPSALVQANDPGYNDGSSSTFGAPNVFNGGTMSQDFTRLRSFQPIVEDEELDGVRACEDNCPEAYNPTQLNTDGDEFGDACDADQGGEGPGRPAEGCTSVDIFDPDHVLEVEVNITQANWDFLRHQGRRLLDTFGGDCTAGPPGSPYDWVPADITIDGETRTNIGIRKKGFLGSLDTVRPSVKVRISRYVESQRLFGTDRFTFNNNKQDPAKIKQCLAYKLFAQAGLAAPRCSFARLKVTTENGTQDLGIYTNVEDIEAPFVTRNFGNASGNLYEGSFGADFRPRSLPIWEKENNEDTNDGSDLRALAEVLGQANDEELLAAVGELVDIDDFFTYWAMEGLIGHWDGYAGDINNNFLYRDGVDGKFRFIPWGTDDTFGQGNPLRGEGQVSPLVWARGKLAYRLYLNPAGAARYKQTLGGLFATVWDEAAILAEIDRMQALLLPISDLSANIAPIRTFVNARQAKFDTEFGGDNQPVWTEALPEGFCLMQVGDIDLAFNTKWSAIVPTFPTSGIGIESLSGTLYGLDLAVQPPGTLRYVVAGGTDIASLTGRGIVRLVFQLPGLPEIRVVQIAVPPSEIVPGATIEIDSDLTNAYVLVEGMTPLILGALADGEVRFDAENASTVPGQTIAGELEAKITQFGPAPGSCAGDCDRDTRVTAADLVGAMAASPAGEEYGACEEVDSDEDFRVSPLEVDAAIRQVFGDCPTLPPISIQP